MKCSEQVRIISYLQMSYDIGSSSMDYSNRMTGLYGICSPEM